MSASSERYIKKKAVVGKTTAFIVVPIESLSHSVKSQCFNCLQFCNDSKKVIPIIVSLDFFSQFCIEIKEQFWVVFRDYFSWLV